MEDNNQEQPKNDYSNFEPRETPPWRIFLSIALAVIAVIRLAYTCSGGQQKQNRQSDEFKQMMEQSQTEYEESSRRNMEESQRKSNDVMYTDYDGLNDLPAGQQATYKLIKIKKDSLMRLDISTQIKIGKNSYFQKNFDDSLQLAIKTPENMTIFIHDFAGKGDLKFNFMEMKRKYGITDFKAGQIAKATTYSYKITQNGKPFNGFAIASAGNGYFWFMEFESDKIKKEALKEKALLYIAANLGKVKK